MATARFERTEPRHNPLDILEELVSANEWRFDRSADEEMVVELPGRWCDFRMFFVWHEDLEAVYFSCTFDLRVPAHKRGAVAELLALINEKLWLGHFDVCSDELVPMFRHTVLLRGAGGVSPEQLEDLVDIAISECERFYPAFQFLLWGGRKPDQAIEAALLDTVGEA
ncbi:MAG TPA: YbjN domain-containing protein [Hypericibacter adhaerens]|jgi:hypothetical protein|uniref:YbjN domain-containing protein n=1 Tax=Hypericibacter adhaerens TaxID=2602016 RepID=A0A5J6N269_9PROT|nr:YbjN domain-containing protein [Hypericibacter adhaerens]QEX21036.1 hypothetical protein FRZ61_09560 [Hypericibacter adhaerens]HWA42324.1 YbjN domain-containing protein [Hypericibacter adhaerens]